jgi:hypothetical protein
MNKFLLLFFVAANAAACAQGQDPIINVKEAERIENVLASDGMQGRKAGTPFADKAADFIAGEFRKAGLQPLSGNSFLQQFSVISPRFLGAKLEIDDVEIDTRNVIVITSQPELKVNEKSGYEIQRIGAGERLSARVQSIMASSKNVVAFVDTSFSRNFSRLSSFKRQMFASPGNLVLILGNYEPKEFTVKAEHRIEEIKMSNVVGIIPGKSRKNEYVIFSAHYDHIGVGKPVDGDSIYNGANDDAAGTAAVILLANYFKKQNNNERTVVFVGFTAEESGGFGARYFSEQLKPEQVAAMFNIEMIGTESKWGKNSAYITGYDKSDMGTIMQKNLEGTSFTFHPDPYPTQQLFYRSDNATLARLGVPAHTISTAKMENEPHYHKPSDEVKTLDLQNMTEIIRAIALSSRSIVAGKDTPSRVKVEDLAR